MNGFGLTYRDVERASFELAARRGRPELILHISRLADIENRGVVPGLHKLYTLAAVYHLNPLEIFRWYDVPIEDCFPDGGAFHAPHTHLAAPPVSLKTPLRFDPAFDPKRTELLSRMVEKWGSLEGVLTNGNARHRYGYIGLSDRRMVPLLRPGSVVLVDVTVSRIQDDDWANEYDRPMYFVELRERLSMRMVSAGRRTPAHATPPSISLCTGGLAPAGRSRSGRPRCGSRYEAE